MCVCGLPTLPRTILHYQCVYVGYMRLTVTVQGHPDMIHRTIVGDDGNRPANHKHLQIAICPHTDCIYDPQRHML